MHGAKLTRESDWGSLEMESRIWAVFLVKGVFIGVFTQLQDACGDPSPTLLDEMLGFRRSSVRLACHTWSQLMEGIRKMYTPRAECTMNQLYTTNL